MREAPGIEERRIELMDIARQVAQDPINLPDYQVAGLGALEQQGIGLAGQTGVGAQTVQQGINQINQAAAPIGAAQIATIFKSISIICYWRNRKTIQIMQIK